MYRPSGERAAAPALPVVVIWEIFMFCRLKPRVRPLTHSDTTTARARTAAAATTPVRTRLELRIFGTARRDPLVTATLPELVSRFSLLSSERISAALW